MMQFKPFLKVNRLVVTKGKTRAYDEKFHAGVNIIRGKNSSGKSTISDFIFYGLGGDLTKFKNEALLCDFVYTEVDLSGKIFTLKRVIKEGGKQGMEIFAGALEAANIANQTDWIRYPYNANTKESFYQALFKEIGIPYSKSDDKNSITMHQLLRMMYVDQMTSPDRLFKFDRFDSPNKRRAIGELLIGVSDFELYEKRVSLQKQEAVLDKKTKEIQTIHSFLGSSIKTLDDIEIEINEKQAKIEGLESEIDSFSSTSESESEEENLILHKLIEDVRKTRKERSDLKELVSKTLFEISDSQLFISSLDKRVLELKNTKKTISALSDISFHHCPACQEELAPKQSGCTICGSENVGEDVVDPTFKVRKEIEFQIEESKKLIEFKQYKVDEYNVSLSQTDTQLSELERELNIARKPQRTVSIELRQKLKEVGALKSQINALNNSKERFSKLYTLYDEREAVQSRVNKLKNDIDRLTTKHEGEMRRKKNRLAAATLALVRADKDHEEIFNEGKKIEFDFAEDRVTIDERGLFSASSMVYLKNAFRLAMLQASCEDNSYLYPRFLLMDNIEDKGMEPIRSRLFQNEIIKASSNIETDHQIIFTTSMIDPELDGSEYCVGEFYSDKNKTLKV